MTRKKRKHRSAGGQERAEATDVVTARATPEWRLPSRNARIGGVILAVITTLFALGTGVGAFDDGLSSADMVLRLGVTALLAALAIVMTALSLAPAWTRTVIMRVRG